MSTDKVLATATKGREVELWSKLLPNRKEESAEWGCWGQTAKRLLLPTCIVPWDFLQLITCLLPVTVFLFLCYLCPERQSCLMSHTFQRDDPVSFRTCSVRWSCLVLHMPRRWSRFFFLWWQVWRVVSTSEAEVSEVRHLSRDSCGHCPGGFCPPHVITLFAPVVE